MTARARRIPVRTADGTELVVHHWAATPARSAALYIHGIQSHSGWLYETGPQLAARGVHTYAVDRRGSGISGGARGYLPDCDTIVEDYLTVIEAIRAHTELPLIAVGQSFGGSVLSAVLARRPDVFDGVVFTAPAIAQQRNRHSDAALAQRRNLRGMDPCPIPLEDADYTGDSESLRFMAADPLMLHQVPARTLATMVELEDAYMGASEWAVRVPVRLAVPARDRIIDLEVAALALSTRLPQLVTKRLDADHHYIEFTDARGAYWDWLAAEANSMPGRIGAGL